MRVSQERRAGRHNRAADAAAAAIVGVVLAAYGSGAATTEAAGSGAPTAEHCLRIDSAAVPVGAPVVVVVIDRTASVAASRSGRRWGATETAAPVRAHEPSSRSDRPVT